MRQSADVIAFLSATSYTDPVDIKKLEFVFGAVERCASELDRSPDQLDVLEVACGVGGITLPLAAIGCRVRAFDIDGPDVAELTRRAANLGLDNIHATVDDAFTFDDGRRYDVVVASEVFEHVLDPAGLAAVIRRHMKPGAYLVFTTPNGYGPWEIKNTLSPFRIARRWNWLRRLAGKARYVEGAGRDHCQRFTKQRLLDLFGNESMRLVAAANSDFVLTMSRALRRNPALGKLDARIADALPHWMASGWYMLYRLEEKG